MRRFGKRKEKECEYHDFCSCTGRDLNTTRCEMCVCYRMIDSGFGYCFYLPTLVVVPWCRKPCGCYVAQKSD